MILEDKDLLSIQEVRNLIKLAKSAQESIMTKSQDDIDRLVYEISSGTRKFAYELGEMANKETGFGNPEHKKIKNLFASISVYEQIKDMKTIGIIKKWENGVMDVAVPMGVVAALIPSTNPTSTVIYKSLISIKSGNSIIFSPHPNAKECILKTVSIIREIIKKCGFNENLVSSITIPTMQATKELMHNHETAVILATGGAAMVHAAYSSGNPAIGVGPGNGPAFIEKTADIKLAVKRILDSKTFDNGTICASEQSIIVEECSKSAVEGELQAQGAYILSKEQADKLAKYILRANGTMNPQIVGKTANQIAELALIDIPANTRVIVARESGVGKKFAYSNEKLCPILGFYVEPNYEMVCDKCVEILNFEGVGHSFMLHTNNDDIIDYFAKRIPVSRIMVNCGGATGGIGATTHLFPALTLGCGTLGGSSISDNVSPLNLINIKRVAKGYRDSIEFAGVENKLDGIDIHDIVKVIIEKMKLN